jgi:hypothetical protein
MLRHDNILARAARAGLPVAFANAYPRALIDAASRGGAKRLPSFINAGPPLVAAGAGVFDRDEDDLRASNAVASEITNDGWRRQLGIEVPSPTAREAGHTLARISSSYTITLFAHYATDTAGHSKDIAECVAALERLDEFLGGVTETMAKDCVLIVASDHGNIEDVRRGHTRNAAFGMIAGPGHSMYASGITSLLHIAPMIARILDVA